MLRNAKLIHIMALVVLAPALATLLLAGRSTLEEHAAVVRLDAVAEVVESAGALSALVHEQQKERGLTAGFIAGGGSVLREELRDQRRATDAALARLEAAADGSAMSAELAGLAERARGLSAVRRQVDELSVAGPAAVGAYTSVNAAMLERIARWSRASGEASLGARLAAYAAFLQAKEHAGLERAVGSAGFAGGFDAALHDRLVELGSAQAAHLMAFHGTAEAEDAAALDALAAGPAWAEVARLRSLALAGGPEAAGVSAADWFAAATKRIEEMKRFEDGLADSLRANLAELRASAGRARLAGIGIALGALTVSIAIAAFAATSLRRAVRELVTAMGAIASGDLDAPTPPETANELGQAAGALRVLSLIHI